MGGHVTASNFLVPNATFFVELFIFVLVLLFIGKFAGPPINKALTDRQASIKKRIDDLDDAKARADAAEHEYKSQLVEARHEAARIREEAREEGAAIIAEMREQGQAEKDRIVKSAQVQVEAERQAVVQQLRGQLGTMATTLAGRIVGESLEDDERRNRTVERFISTLESQDAIQQGQSGRSR
jgi:F-type H+-transporting ATPase subunit b